MDRATVTAALYQPPEHAEPLQAIDVAGAVVPIWICCDLTCSALPALSTEKNSTSAVAGTVNGPVYTVLEVVGSVPSVV